MKTFRQNFEEDYTAVKEPCDNKRGFKVRYVYVGLWYGWDIGRGGTETLEAAAAGAVRGRHLSAAYGRA